MNIQWGSEIRPLEIRKHLKCGLFEGRISNGPYVVGFQMVPNIGNLDHSNTEQRLIIQNLDMSGFQIPTAVGVENRIVRNSDGLVI